MKILFIESKQKNLPDKITYSKIKKLPKKLFLAYSIQYKDLATRVKEQLIKNKIKVEKFQQVLGCSNISNKNKLPVLLIGSGEFHAINLYLQSSGVYILENNKIRKIPDIDIKKIKAHKKAALLKFLAADNIGILVSTKPGQENLKKATSLKQKLEKKNKKAYIFLANNIDITQFENFQIDSWVNTACPGLSFDNPNIIPYSELPAL